MTMTAKRDLRNQIIEMAVALEDEYETRIDWRDLSMVLATGTKIELEALRITLRDRTDACLWEGVEPLE